MGLLDSVMAMFGGSKDKKVPLQNNPIADALSDGKIDMNDAKDLVTDQLDQNNDGKLDMEDLKEAAQDQLSNRSSR